MQGDEGSERASAKVTRALDTCLAALTDHFDGEPEEVQDIAKEFSAAAPLHDRYNSAQVLPLPATWNCRLDCTGRAATALWS